MYDILYSIIGNHTKFTAESITLAEQWVHVIRDAIINEESILRRQVHTSHLHKNSG